MQTSSRMGFGGAVVGGVVSCEACFLDDSPQTGPLPVNRRTAKTSKAYDLGPVRM